MSIMSFNMCVMFFGVDAILLSIGVETCDKWNWIWGRLLLYSVWRLHVMDVDVMSLRADDIFFQLVFRLETERLSCLLTSGIGLVRMQRLVGCCGGGTLAIVWAAVCCHVDDIAHRVVGRSTCMYLFDWWVWWGRPDDAIRRTTSFYISTPKVQSLH